MFALVRAVRVSVADIGRQQGKVAERLPAIFASVFALFTPFVKFVFALIGAIRMTVTVVCRQRGY